MAKTRKRSPGARSERATRPEPTPAPRAVPRHAEEQLPALCAKEAATALGVHLQTVYKALRCGGLRGSKVGSRWRVSRSAFDEALRNGIATELRALEASELAAAG